MRQVVQQRAKPPAAVESCDSRVSRARGRVKSPGVSSGHESIRNRPYNGHLGVSAGAPDPIARPPRAGAVDIEQKN